MSDYREDIIKLFKESSIETSNYRVDYEYNDNSISKDFDVIMTKQTITNRHDGSSVSKMITLLEVPKITQLGCNINGTYYMPLGVDKQTPGWYILNKAIGSKKELITELIPKKGAQIKFRNRNGTVTVISGSKSKVEVNISIFLKALTGKSIIDIGNMLGIHNVYTERSLKDLPRDECIDKVLAMIYKTPSILPKSRRYQKIKTRFLDEKFLCIEDNDKRINNTLFLNRALGKDLGRDLKYINSNGEEIKINKKTTLTREMLIDIDNSDVDTLFIYYNSKIYELKKYKIPRGNTLSEEELFTYINMYMVALDGYEVSSDSYELYNRKIVYLKDRVIEDLRAKLTTLTNKVDEQFDINGETINVADVEESSDINPRSLVDSLKTEDKQMEINSTINYLSMISKGSKVISDASGSHVSEDMITVKNSEVSAFDSYAQPEGDKIGQVHTLTLTSRINKEGEVETPVIKIKNGRPVDGNPIYLSVRQRMGAYIAPWDEDLKKSNVSAYYNGTLVKVPNTSVEYQEYSSLNNLSPQSCIIPFIERDQGKRITMSINQNTQAPTTIHVERPLVTTGVYGLLCNGDAPSVFDNSVMTAENILEREYQLSHEYKNMNLNDFKKLPIKLISTSHQHDTRVLRFKFEFNGEPKIFETDIVYFYRTDHDNVCQYNIIPKDGNVYSGKDIVCAINSVDITECNYVTKFNNVSSVNYGKFCTPSESEFKHLFRSDLAIGNNVLIAYKVYSSCSMDDSMVMSDRLLGTPVTQRILLHEIKVKLYDDEIASYTGSDTRFNTSGQPKMTSIFYPKEIIFHKHRIKNNLKIPTPVRLDAVTGGVVIDVGRVHQDDYVEYTIKLANIKDVEPADKYSGSHGNKGVIGKIVPESDMPLMPDGRHIDILLNPLGIPSRMNFAQIPEALIGLAMDNRYRKDVEEAKSKGIDPSTVKKYVAVISPQTMKSKDIKAFLKDEEIEPVVLRDGRTGVPFKRAATVGIAYLKPLYHTADSIFNATGDEAPKDAKTLQVKKGKKIEGGQSEGEMEQWVLAACGMDSLMQEHASIQSDDVEVEDRVREYMAQEDRCRATIGSSNNQNDTYLTAITRCLGVNLVTENGDYKPRFMKDEDITKLSFRSIELQGSDLQNQMIFGTAGKSAIKTYKSKKMWGYMKLNCEIVHPTVVRANLASLLVINKKTIDTSTNKDKVSLGPLNTSDVTGLINRTVSITFDPDVPLLMKGDCSDAIYNFETGMEALVKLLRTIDLDPAEKYYSNKRENTSKLDDKFKCSKILSRIHQMKVEGFKLSDFVISHLPVMPVAFRQKVMDRDSDIDRYYRKIMTAALSNADKELTVYNLISEFCGYLNSNNNNTKKRLNNLSDTFTDKNNGIRGTIMGKNLKFSGRCPIVPAEAGTMKLTEFGYPFKQATVILANYIFPAIVREFDVVAAHSEDKEFRGDFLSALGNQDIYSLSCLLNCSYSESESYLRRFIDIVKDIAKDRVFTVGRQPSLHGYSIRALVPKIVFDKAMHIHPLLDAGFNCDFDGDQMHDELIITDEVAKEALQKMSPASDYINIKDGSFVLEPTQDILLGCYEATMLQDNCTSIEGIEKYNDFSYVKFYTDLELLKFNIRFGETEYDDIICYTTKEGKTYCSTAGRILFNSLLPGGFTDNHFTNPLQLPYINEASEIYDLRFDTLVRKRSDTYEKYYNPDLGENCKTVKEIGKYSCCGISTVTKYICDKLSDGAEVCNVMNEIFIFGSSVADIFSLSIWYSDFIEYPKLDELISKSDKIMDKIHKYCDMGLMTDEYRKDTIIKIYNYMTDKVEKELLDYYPRNNNLFIIMDSGARGNLSQLMQTCGLVGIVQKDSKSLLETPVLSNYFRGLSSSDQNSVSYGTRNGFAHGKQETAKAGEVTRLNVYTLSNFTVKETDCHGGYHKFKVEYMDEAPSTFINGKQIPFTNLLGRFVDVTDDHYSEYSSMNTKNFDGEITKNTLNYIKKNHIKSLKLDDDEVIFRFKLTPMFKDMMKNRLAKGLKYLSIISDNEGVITDKTLDYIEEENLEYINVRTMLTCSTIGGVCQHCYGISISTGKFPLIGERIGVKAAQATGEVSTQAQLDLSNKAGKAGDINVVELFKQLCKGSLPSNIITAKLSPSTGFAEVTDLGKNTCGVKVGESPTVIIPKDSLYVVNGEYVKMGDRLSNHMIRCSEIERETPEETLRSRQIELLKIFNSLFSDSGIYVNIRNFEILVRAQTSLARVYKSTNPNFKEGNIYFLQELLNDGAKGVEYYTTIEKAETILNHYSGFLANYSHSYIFQNIANSACYPDFTRTPNNSFLSKMIVGQDLTDDNPKILHQPGYQSELSSNKEEISNEFLSIEELTDEDIENFGADINSLFGDLELPPSEEFSEDDKNDSESEKSEGIILETSNIFDDDDLDIDSEIASNIPRNE